MSQTEKTIHALLSGHHPNTKKYAGRQVFVIGEEIVPLKKGKRSLDDFRRLREEYKKSPTLIFVPQPGATYILIIK